MILLVDGSIQPDLTSHAKTTQVEAIIKGDLKVLTIAVASIIAKVTRDHMMIDLARIHPEYGWEKIRAMARLNINLPWQLMVQPHIIACLSSLWHNMAK